MIVPPASDLTLARDREAILAAIVAARTAYVPDWTPATGGAAHGLANITAGFLELLQERLRRLPAHRQAVLLDLLGASVLPAQGARTHVLLTAVPGTRGARVPAGTRIGATVPERSDPVVFETQDSVSISPATIVEAHSVDPAADAEQDHSADLLAHRPFTLFGATTPVERALYVGHDELLAFDGRAVVELEIGLSASASRPLPLAWQWWDGTLWRPFAAVAESALAAGDDDSLDGSAGLTRSGTVRLVAPTAASKPLELDGRETHWIRGVLTTPVAGVEALPTISRLRLAVVNEHARLRVQRVASTTGAGVRVWWPDGPPEPLVIHVRDLSSGTSVDTYSGAGPTPGYSPTIAAAATQALAAQVGHEVRLGVSVARSRPPGGTPTATEPARVANVADDDLTSSLSVASDERIDVAVAAGLALDKGIADERAVDLSKTFAPLGPSPVQGTAFVFACETATRRPGSRVTLLIERPRTAAEEADANADLQRDAARATEDRLAAIIATLKGADATGALQAALQQIDAALPVLRGPGIADPAGNEIRTAAAWFALLRASVRTPLVSARSRLTGALDTARTTALAMTPPIPSSGLPAAVYLPAFAGIPFDPQHPGIISDLENATNLLAGLEDLIPASIPNDLLAMEPKQFLDQLKTKLDTVRGHVARALATLTTAITDLEGIDPAALAVEMAREDTTTLTPPELEWEYHDGRRWRRLGMAGDPKVLALQASGPLRFTVPDDIAAVDIDGDVRRWLRARLSKGTFAHMSLVSWTDTKNTVNFLPVIEPRAPMIDKIEVFYTHRSAPTDAAAVVAVDAHESTDLTTAVTWPGPGGTPFAPLPERAPTVYLGLDGELPADRIGLWVQPAAVSPWITAHRPLWEGWNGREWVRLVTDDGTDGFRREGVVGLVWPGTDAAPGLAVSGALGDTIRLLGKGAAQRLSPGDRLMLADVQGQEPVVVAAAQGETVVTRTPLTRAYAGAQLVAAPPARFGVPRTWIRATFDPARAVPALELAALAAHAVAVAQVETLRDEVLGSGDGSPGQVLVARRYPFAGDVQLEVRELDGDRADLDREVLLRTLAAGGVDPSTVRTVQDPRSGRTTEVWVPWRAVPSLGAAEADDRVFVVDRAQGRVLFGGGGHGRPLPAGRDNARLRSYATTEGAVGNVAAGSVDKLLSAVAVGEVTNPLPATGGADVEDLGVGLRRAAALTRHRRLALTEADVEAIAREASPGVVRARAIGARDRFGRPLPGAVRVVVVPRDGTAAPQPGAALLATVRDALVAASPAVATGRLVVEGPLYRPTGVAVTVLPVSPARAGAARERALGALEEFLHPLRGGPDGTGWDFGQGAHLSDVARLLESLDGVDAVTGLALLVDGVVMGDSALVRPDQIVCAGPLTVQLGGGD